MNIVLLMLPILFILIGMIGTIHKAKVKKSPLIYVFILSAGILVTIAIIVDNVTKL